MGGVILNPILHPDPKTSVRDDVFHDSTIPPLDMHVSRHDVRLVCRKGGW